MERICDSVILNLLMFASEETHDRVLVAVAVLAASLIHISIAASQILLGIGILLLLLFRGKLLFPRIWIPLAAFFLWTALADVLSPDPWGGRAQLKKFFVFFFIPVLYSIFLRQFSKISYLIAGWAIAATASGAWAIVQYVTRYRNVSYQEYVGHRITGFESHWMTFSALQLSVLSILLAQLFFLRSPAPAMGLRKPADPCRCDRSQRNPQYLVSGRTCRALSCLVLATEDDVRRSRFCW